MTVSWTFEDLRPYLRLHPRTLEPGLRFLELGSALTAAERRCAWASDPLGRPVRVMGPEDDPQVFDTLLDWVTRLRREPDPRASAFLRPTEPRVILLAEELPSALVERLDLLADRLPVRLFRVERGGAEDAPEPRFRLLEEGDEGAHEALLAGLPHEPARLARRLLAAAAVLRPPVFVQGGRWPLLFAGRGGRFASLHRDGDHLVFVGPTETPGGLELDGEAAADRAVDAMMRQQHHAAGEALGA